MREHKTSNRDLSQLDGEIPLKSLYTFGIAGEEFFRALKDRGVLIASRCKPCKQVYLPSRIFCERCFAELTEKVEIEPVGKIRALTTARVGLDEETLEAPVSIAAVQFDKTTTALVHRLSGEGRIGMKVRAVLKPQSERTGSIEDILHFEPNA